MKHAGHSSSGERSTQPDSRAPGSRPRRLRRSRRASRQTKPPRLMGARLTIVLMWLLHWLPLPLIALFGRILGWLLWQWAPARRKVALINLSLCYPELEPHEREKLARRHFGWLGRSLLERSVLWFASERRLKRLVRVHGEVLAAQRSRRPVMWLLPHFVGLEFCAPALLLNQTRPVVDIFQRQSNPVWDARLNAGRTRFGNTELFDRAQGIRPVIRAIQRGAGFVNAFDMDFGSKDSAFVPFFGIDAATLLAPGRLARSMDMLVQTVVVTLRPWGLGYEVEIGDAPEGFDDEDPVRAARAFNLWLEGEVRRQPAQYFWVHRRFKTRPPGQPWVY